MKGKTHDLNYDLTFSAHTFNWVCHSIRSMFRVLGIYNFAARAGNDPVTDGAYDLWQIADVLTFK